MKTRLRLLSSIFMLAVCMNAIAVPPPVVTWNNSLQGMCINYPSLQLYGGLPSGGTYSGPGVSGNIFNPYQAGVGLHTLSYSFTDTIGVTDTAFNTIEVFSLPVVTFPYNLAPQCVSSTAYILTGGSPPGGTYSGPGMTGTNFNASVAGVGTHAITYSYTDAHQCFNSATNSIVVLQLPLVAFNGVLVNQCVSSTTYTLTGGSPPGGTYSGPGVTGANFNASIAGVGTHTITYSFRDANSCQNAATNPIVVNPLPLVAFNGTLNNQCVSTTTYTLTGGSPPGGTYSGPGVTGTNFNASIAGVGTHTLTYTYISAMTECMSAATKTITVYPLPVVTMPTFPDVCISTPGFYLSGGLPYNGTYSINGVYGSNLFNPGELGVGNHIISYTYTNQNACSRTASDDIIVYPLPALQWTTPLQSQFTSSTTYPLTGGLPPGGTYSGPGVSGNNFNASLAGPGLHTLTYSFTDANSCSSSVSNTILTLLPPDTLSDLSGILSYANTVSTKLENATIQLTKNGTLIAETLTNANGEYLFSDLQPGTYILKAIVNQPGGGGNAVDALLIMKHFVGMATLSSPWLEACDVDASFFVNATDGLEVMKRFVGIVNSYPSGDWFSETAVITLSGGFSGVQNLKTVCFGDVDGSFEP